MVSSLKARRTKSPALGSLLNMATSFNRDEVAVLLVQCHRRCCICHRYCGTKIETDHIVPASESQDHSIANAIPVCFDCHAEVHAYNPKHPRGRRFTPEELRMHKKQWLKLCKTRPEILVEGSRNIDIGPIQGLLDELDHNLVISAGQFGFMFRDEQLTRVIREGVLSTLDDSLRQDISSAYGAISRANEGVRQFNNQLTVDISKGIVTTISQDAVQKAIPLIQAARDRLLEFVRSE